MALKYGSKKGGFGLRSGNKSGMPFKQMGSSPAQHKAVTGDAHEHSEGGKKVKHGPDGEVLSLTGKDAIREVTNNYDTSLGGEDTVVKTDMDEFRKNTVVVDGKTYDKGEEPQDKSEKKGFFQKLGEGLKSDTFRSAAYGAASAAAINPAQKKMYSDLAQKYGPKKYTETQLQDKEYKNNQIKLQNQKIKAFEDAQNKENELNTTNSTATTDDGHANLDTTKYKTTSETVQEQIAADKAKMKEDSYATYRDMHKKFPDTYSAEWLARVTKEKE